MGERVDPEIVGPPYGFIANGLKKGRVIPFFGAAASAVYRPPNEPWEPGRPFMPFGSELAMTLARAANYPKNLLTGPPDLALIASWAEHVQGTREYVNDNLHKSFAVECNPGDLDRTITGVDATRLFITTNYDDLLEKALAPRQPHLIIDRGSHGLWVSASGKAPEQVPPTGDRIYELLNDEKTQAPSHPVLFKMHGSVDKIDPDRDCYLITEEDYVDFLGRDSGYYVPPYVSALMQGKDFLFLGYSLSDWNVRVILRKLLKRTTAARPVRCWAIVSGKTQIAQQVWQAQNLNIYPMDLPEFAKELASHL
jgi:SIR2-like domain